MAQVAVVVFAAVALAAVPQASADHPIEAVISLLEKLEVEAQREGANEAESFQKMQHWCKRSTRMLERSIKKEKKAIDTLQTKVDGLVAQIAGLDEDLSKINKDLQNLEEQRQKAEQMRNDEHDQYVAESENLGGSIDAAEIALDSLQSSEVLISVHAAVHKAAQPKPRPEAKTFESHQGGVIETFKGLEEDWAADKLSVEEEETTNAQAYKLAKTARDTRIKNAEDVQRQREHTKSEAESAKGEAEGELNEQQRALKSDSDALKQTTATCTMNTEEWDERSATRSGEMEAMKMAVKILSKVTGVRNPDTHVVPTKALLQATAQVEQDTSDFGIAKAHAKPRKALVQAKASVHQDSPKDFWANFFGPSFLQVDDPKAKIAALLRTVGAASHSKALQKLAEKIRTYDGPFDKIKAMMQKMSFRLMAEQKDEDDHKAWCDIEVEKSETKKADEESKKDLLTAKTNEMDTAIKLLKTAIRENEDKVRTINEEMAEETKLRTENRNEIEATIQDSLDSQAALTEAIKVLTEFYKKSGMVPKEPFEFLQTGDVELPERPSTWDASYTGVSDPKSGPEGVLVVLDETLQKFSQMEADAKVADASDQKEYEEDMAAKQAEITATKMDSEMKTTKRDELEEALSSGALDLKRTTEQIRLVKVYMKDLEPACGEGDSSYEDRKKARMDEVDALKKAEGILAEAFQQKAFLQQSA